MVLFSWASTERQLDNFKAQGRDQGGIAELFGGETNSDQAPAHPSLPTVIQSDGYAAYPAWTKGKDHIRRIRLRLRFNG